MKKSTTSLITLFMVCGSIGTSCAVNTKDLRFDDDEYDRIKNEAATGDGDGDGGHTGDGDGDGSGGKIGMTGDGDGDRPGGATGSGGAVNVEPDCVMVGELQCDDKQVQVCSGEFFIDAGKPCEFLCLDGACTGSCEPGLSECVSETEQRACGTKGQWGEPSQCTNVCVGDRCGGKCKPGARSCDESDATLKLLCNSDGQWDSEGNCSVGDCSDGACTSCSGNETQCTADSQGVQTCESGSYGIPTDCKDQVCIDGGCTGECRPALGGNEPQRSCVKGEPSIQLETCGADGNFGSASNCNFVCVQGSDPGKNDTCGGVCKPGAQRCEGSVVFQCSDDGMTEKKVENCEDSGLSCLDLGGGSLGCGECTPGSTREPNNRCAQRIVQTCEKGKWVNAQDCSKLLVIGKNVSICYEGACVTGNEACDNSRDRAYGCLDDANKWTCSSASTTGIDSASCIKSNCTLTSCITGFSL